MLTATINGLELNLDEKSGSILGMSYEDMQFLNAENSKEATILDLAYPIPKFEPLRLASRYSKDAKIDVKPNEITITWEKLGASRNNFKLEGNVKATVKMQAMEDKKSILMTCKIENNSPVAVRQVIFPDFMSVMPFCGEKETYFKTSKSGDLPFMTLHPTEYTASQQFCMDAACYSKEYASGGKFSDMMMRWFDFGGLKGGFSMFPKRWGWDPRSTVRLTHSETAEKMRISNIELVDINPGETWESGDYVFTPHLGGWAKGIETYAAYAYTKTDRKYPVPKHIEESIGFRSIWAAQSWEEDPQDAVWTFADMPKLAEDSAEHGLHEINIWSFHRGFELPLPDPYSNVGTLEEFAGARKICQKKYNVELTPFISIMIQAREALDRYGIPQPQGDGNNWTQHTETIPRFQPTYSRFSKGEMVGPTNKMWLKDALEGMKRYIDAGLPSISWDQYFNISKADDNNMVGISEEIRAYQKAADPDATWSGEEVFNMEISMDWLDYTWNWGSFQDLQAFNSIFKYPRINVNITYDTLDAKKCFLDNIFINIFPRRANDINGSAYIKELPKLSQALKKMANIKKDFLPYFTQGRYISNCICYKTPTDSYVSAYILNDKALVMVLNTGSEENKTIECDFACWIGESNNYIIKAYDENCQLLKVGEFVSGKHIIKTPKLSQEEIIIYEITNSRSF